MHGLLKAEMIQTGGEITRCEHALADSGGSQKVVEGCCFAFMPQFEGTHSTCLPKGVLYGQVKGGGIVGWPRTPWNEVLLSDTQNVNMRSPEQFQAKTATSCT